MGRIATGWLMFVVLVGCGGDEPQLSDDQISEVGLFTYHLVESLKSDDRSDPQNGRISVQGLIENIQSMKAAEMGEHADKYARILQGAKELDQLYGRVVAGEQVEPSEFDQIIDEMIAVAGTLPGAGPDERKLHRHT